MNARTDALIALALAGTCLAAWLWLIPAFAGSGEQTVMPRLAVALTGGLSLLLLGASLLRAGAGGAAPAEGASDDPFLEIDAHGEPPRLLVITALWGVVLVFPGFFGLYPGSAIALCLTLLVLGIRRPLVLALWTALPIAALHLVFEYGFGLRIPRGALLALITG